MRKRFILLCVSSILGICAFAAEITEQEAFKKAQHFMAGKKFMKKAANRRAASEKQQAFYVFNIQENGGFVIVSGDDRTPDILGYADKGTLDIENAPCNVKWLLSCYEKTIDSLRLVQDDVSASHKRAARRSAKAEIAPMITTHWGQGAPYNNMCPEVNGNKCLTGCVATAMAQIMNYHKWPQGNTAAIDAYTTGSQGINVSALEASTFDWDNMKDEYYNVLTTDAEKEAVAKLMRYCGQAVNMDYGLGTSGATRPQDAFINVFDYSTSTEGFVGINSKAERLEELVYNELAENRPVYYQGNSSSLGGHAFVVDGYKADGTFHINWGWNGDADGYFVLTGLTEDIMPFPFDFSTELCTWIEPKPQNQISAKVICSSFGTSERSLYRNLTTDAFYPSITIGSSLWSDIEIDNIQIGVALYSEEGELVQLLSSDEVSFPIVSNSSENNRRQITFGADIPLGNYIMSPVFRKNEGDEWKKVVRWNGIHKKVHVNERSIVFENQYGGDEYQDYGVCDIGGVTYKLYSEYKGNKRADILPYQVRGKYAGSIVIPNELEYEGTKYFVYGSAFNPFNDCDELTSVVMGADTGVRIEGCDNLKHLIFTHGQTASVENCNSLEDVEFAATMDYPNIRNCAQLKTIRVNCKAVNWENTTVDWDSESMPALTDVYLYTATPPLVGSYMVFVGGNIEYDRDCDIPANENAILHVPIGSRANYLASRWKLWNIVDDVEAEPYVTWGYCHSDAVTTGGIGYGESEEYSEIGIRIPSDELRPYIGHQITHIQVYSPNRVQNNYGYEDYEYVFVTKPGVNYLAKKSFDIVRGTWNTIELDEPYTITGDELFVGTGKYGQLAMNFSDETYVYDASWCRSMIDEENSSTGWILPCPKDLAHPLPIRFVIEGTDMPEGLVIRELGLNGIDDVATARNIDAKFQTSRRSSSSISLNGVIRNRSLDPVESYTIKYTIDAGEPQTKSIETIMVPNATENVSIELPASLNDGRNHTISTDVTLVNGANNGLMGVNMPAIDIVKLLGDVNGDNSVSVSDVINTISHVLKDTPNLFIRGAAQMNDDDEISVTDVIGLINLALGSNPSRQSDEINMEVE